MAKESINLKEAIQIAKIIMVVPEDRLPMIQEVFEMAGVSIESLSALEEFKSISEQEAVEVLADLLESITAGRELKNGEYCVEAWEFNEICKERELDSKLIRGQLAGLGIIRQSSWTGGHAVTTCAVRENGKVTRCVCIYKNWKEKINF